MDHKDSIKRGAVQVDTGLGEPRRRPARRPRSEAAWFALGILIATGPIPAVGDEGRPGAPSLIVRLVHPDRQAEEVLKLFRGSRAPHPAAALAAWKRATREPNQLGKPLEAVISFLNPEMTAEWGVLHEAEFQLGFDPKCAAARWRMAVPRDDGTFAALITALRLSGGGHETPLEVGGRNVERLGGKDAAVGLRSDPQGVVLASMPEGLGGIVSNPKELSSLDDAIGSGMVFRADPGTLTLPDTAKLGLRRAIELARGLGCRRAIGSIGLRGDRLALDVDTEFEGGQSLPGREQAAPEIDPAWLGWVPADEAVAFASLALGRGAAFWDALFAAADRVDRVDPSRVELAPLRTRVNLLATAAGIRLEADLWPHLRGITVALLVDRETPARPTRVLVALHLDEPAAARRVVDDVLPRLAGLASGFRKPTKAPPNLPGPRQLGRIAGRPLEASLRGRDVVVGWGEGTHSSALKAGSQPERSASTLLDRCRAGPRTHPPDRAGAIWPGRMPLRVRWLDSASPLTRALAGGDPIVWAGWTHADHAVDRVSWAGLPATVRRFLESVPLAETPASQAAPASRQ